MQFNIPYDYSVFSSNYDYLQAVLLGFQNKKCCNLVFELDDYFFEVTAYRESGPVYCDGSLRKDEEVSFLLLGEIWYR